MIHDCELWGSPRLTESGDLEWPRHSRDLNRVIPVILEKFALINP